MSGAPRSAARRWLPPAALALLPLLVFAPVALLRGAFYVHDIQHYFYPYHALAAGMVARGRRPLWNPYAFSGIPLLGDGQTALFYPPSWLFFALPGAAALGYDTLLQFSIAGVGMYLFLRALGLWRAPSFVGAVAYMFGGFMTARVVHLSILSGAALVPLLFYCVERALRDGGARRFALAAGAAALQALTGHPQVPVYTALALGLYALARGVERGIGAGDWRAPGRFLLRLAGIYALGYGIAAVQLLPWIDFARFSPRAAGASFDFVFGSSMTGAEWLLLLFPYLYGALSAGPFAAQPMGIVTASKTWEHSAYVGILPLALALVALLDLAGRARRAWRARRTGEPRPAPDSAGDAGGERRMAFAACYFALLLAVGLLMAAGRDTPLSAVIYAAPVIGKLRDVERAIVLAAFALTGLAAIGMQRLVDPGAQGWPRTLIAAALIVALPLGAVLLAGRADPASELGRLEYLRLSRPNAAIPLLLAGASALLLIGWRLRPALAPYLAVALVLLDLCGYAAAFNPTTDPQLYARTPPVVDFLRQDGGLFRKATVLTDNAPDLRVAQDVLAVSWGMVYGVEDINGFNSLQPRRYTDYLFGPDVGDVSYGYLADERLLQPQSPILSALNVKYLLVPSGLFPHIGANFRQVYADGDVRVYENAQAYPRAYFVDSVRAEPDPRAVLRAVTAERFDGRRVALVEAERSPVAVGAPGPAEVTIDSYAADRIALTTVTTATRLLVLSEMDLPGWRAEIDGVETPIYRANYLFRSVVAPEGRHTITFVYRPASALWGAAISAASLLIAVFLLLAKRRRRFRRGLGAAGPENRSL